MIFRSHSELEGAHSFLSPSKYHWLNYSEEKLIDTYARAKAVQRGVELHAFAAEAIRLRQKLVGNGQTLNMYVNDAIGFRMDPEVVLYYSPFSFGTADAIGFNRGVLRIHDLKTGVTPAKMEQLEIYAALFCLEYNEKPSSLKFELRIYQNDEVVVKKSETDDIVPIIDKIVYFDKVLSEYKEAVS